MLNTTHNFRHEPDYRVLGRLRAALVIIWICALAWGLGSCLVHARHAIGVAAGRVEVASR